MEGTDIQKMKDRGGASTVVLALDGAKTGLFLEIAASDAATVLKKM